ncbi:MAG TPA: GAF domain-containing protein [Syntrophorhabdales bacterium]|nr:GAF domain-containing protein [Syntrophorhabdales bacterium]
MIERKAILQITKAIILGLRNGLANPSERIKQNIIEELAEILGVERCVIFKLGCEDVDGSTEDFCEIIAGVPLSEYQADFAKKALLEIHPDLKAAVENRGMLLIKDPHNDSRTAYFKGIVERKHVSEILYVPLFMEEGGQPMGVIVLDAVQGKRFNEDELQFCSEVADLLSLLLEQERVILQHFRDEIINKIVPLGGFAKRLRENLQTTLNYIEIIHEHASEISTIVPKKLGRGL